MNKITKEQFNISCKELAVFLLGKILVRKTDDGLILKGRIVETECYPGGDDKASHSFGNRRTPRTEPMFMSPGTCYVFMTYGMYFCFNISSCEPGGVVLIRALHPLVGLETMRKFRLAKIVKKELKDVHLCNGPSKLCMALNIFKDNFNKVNVADNDVLWLEDDPEFRCEDMKIVTSTRIGIESYGEEYSKKLLRFYVHGCPHVSKRDKHAEKQL